MDGEHGWKVEAEVRDIAGDLGVSDFVFTSPLVSKGAAKRELGDGLLIVGAAGAILQVKARDPDLAATDMSEKANRWASQQITRAVSQAKGSRREIERRLNAEETLGVLPERVAHLPQDEAAGYILPIEGTVADWPSIVVIDHPRADLEVGSDCLIISKEDWLGLYQLLGSVSAMIRYAARVRDSDVGAHLGGEFDRYMTYYEQSAARENANRADLDFLIHPTEAPERGFSILNELAGKLWPADNPIRWQSPEDYRRIVQFLDEVPPGRRHIIGAGLQDLVADYANGGPSKAAIMASRKSQLVVWCSEEGSWASLDDLGAAFGGLTLLRHQEAAGLRPELRGTLGVALLRDGDVTLELYCFTDGSVQLPDDMAAELLAAMGPTPLVAEPATRFG